MSDKKYIIKVPMNYARFTAVIKSYEYFINEQIKHDEENYKNFITGFDDFFQNTVKDCLSVFYILDIFYTNTKCKKYKKEFCDIFTKNKYMNILDVNSNFQECLDKYDVKIKENTDINDLCINFFECFNIEKIKNISEFEQFKTFAITLIENNYFFEILNIEYSFFVFYKDIFIQMVNNFSETIFDNILADKFLHIKSKECYKMLVKNIVNEYKIIEEDIGKNTENWAVNRINIIEKLIITLGIIEFKYLKTPIQVITNEYVKLAKIFKDEEAGKFVNGVLDKILKIYNTKNDD